MRVVGVLPYILGAALGKTKLTALAGLAPYLELAHAVGIREWVEQHIHLRQHGQGGTPSQWLSSGVFLNLAGGDCVDDLDRLNADPGFDILVRRVE